jgi:hypothetical protein
MVTQARSPQNSQGCFAAGGESLTAADDRGECCCRRDHEPVLVRPGARFAFGMVSAFPKLVSLAQRCDFFIQVA